MKKLVFQLAAALTFFTKLPIWRIIDIPSEHFQKMISFWPLTGWITGGLMAGAYLGFVQFFPPIIAVLLALTVRTLFTGGLHEDGLGDFFDGFGGGRTKSDVLRIMKDSHTGSYALIGLIIYYLLLINTLNSIPSSLVASVLLVADPFSKMLTACMMNILPYARPEQESKVKTIFEKLKLPKLLLLFFFGLFPMVCIIEIRYWFAILPSLCVLIGMYFICKKRIDGYTGDVCGATALLCEISFYMCILALSKS